ncbi:MAG: hypothetical protein IRY99_10835 [Isosphaeraceae bacterium]|nr:hypothetical protein [Isosphaeraceae bacterium]
MASTLYIETNFAISITKGQDSGAVALLSARPDVIQLVVPSVCFMEAFSVFESERKQRRKFLAELGPYAREARRDSTSAHAQALLFHLEQANIEGEGVLNDIRVRLYQALDQLVAQAEIIPLGPQVIRDSLTNSLLNGPTDNLILHCILDHARAAAPGPKAFVSANRHDYDQPDAAQALTAVGIRFFARVESALGWLGSQAAP